ncbi:MAG TPA: alpha/beta hydrolase [Polyangiaceae bacterium]
MSVPDRGFVELGLGRRVAYSVTGRTSGVPVLLNRPIGGSMLLWGTFGERLGDVARVIAFDPLGVGESTDAPWLHGTRAMARDAVAVLDHLGVEKADVFGLSLGGMVASWMALDHTERIRRLVLASTIPEPSAVSRQGIEKVLSLGRCFARPGVGAEIALVHRVLSSRFRAARPDRVAAIERQIAAVPATRRNLAALSLSAARHSTSGAHFPAQLPALLVFGELDVLAGESERAELHAELPHAELAVVADSGHDVSLEQPERLAERIVAFLREEPAPST